MNPHPPAGYGLAGASKFGEFCMDSYRSLPELVPVAVWSRTPENASRVAGTRGLRFYGSLAEMARDGDFDIVHVATIPSVHAEETALLLESGKHVLCEKPLATTLSDAMRLQALAEENGRRLSVNFVMRFSPLWRPVRELIGTGVLGELLRGYFINCAGDSGLPEGHWFWDEARSGGIFIEHGVHFFDLARSWFGEGEIISAHRSARGGGKLVDQVHCEARFGSRATVNFYHGFHQPDELGRQQVRLIFESGQIVLRGWIPSRLKIRAMPEAAAVAGGLIPDCRRRDTPRGSELIWESYRHRQSLYGAAIADLMRDFVLAVRDPSHRPRSGASDAVAAVRMAEHATELSKQ